MQQHPLTGSPGSDAVYAKVAAERKTPSISDAALEVNAGIERMQAAARRDPRLNGQDAQDRLRKGGAK
jgi:hypothetical protein